ncbi:MAG: U32 family peptidase [Spirochaetaceae bacterium]
MELLSPAGNPESFKAALESGANAIYVGLPWFNARRPALNFTPDTLKEALKQAHAKGVKVYITLNTDLKSAEIEEAAKVLFLIQELKVDAVIIKDFGLYYLAKKCFPSLELHLSTQFGISNSYAAEQAKKLGATRVIPARELNFSELKALQNSDMEIPEIEAFVQGSMCFSFSGKCLLSSWVGGKSANRGVCQAPCRLKYSNETTEFPFFSMKDLNLVSHLKELKEANITSLKIEGRLKSPGWVGNITSIYNDALKGNLDLKNSSEELLKYSGREMGEGFATGLTNLTAKHRAKFGSYIGKVLEIIEVNDEEFVKVDFETKSPETSLRFVSPEDEFLTILHQDYNSILEGNLIKSNGRITKDSLVFEVIPSRKNKSGIGKMRYDIELEVVKDNIEITVITDTGVFKEFDPYKKVVKEKRGVYPDSVYDKLETKVVNGWRFNKLYSEDILLSKTQVNSIVKIISYILAVTIQESNPLNQIDLQAEVKEFLKPLDQSDFKGSKSYIRVKAQKLTKNIKGHIIIDEVEFNKEILDKIIELAKNSDITISLFPICFEKDMEEIKDVVKYLESKIAPKYEINDIGHYNLLKNYLSVPVSRMVGGQGMACYNYLSLKFLKDELGINDLSVPMELDSRGILKLVEYNNNYANLRFTELSTVPIMYSRVQAPEFIEGAEFVDNIGTVFSVHKYRDLNSFVVSEYYSAEGCKDLEGVKFNTTIADKTCLDNPGVERKKFNLERRLY